MAFFGKEYKFVRQEDFDSFLKAAGLPEEQIPKFLEFKPSSRLDKDGDTYTYITTTAPGAKETKFKSGEEFEDTFMDKIKYKSTYTVDGNTVTQVVTSDLGDAEFKREYNGDELVVTITGSKFDGVAKRWYKA